MAQSDGNSMYGRTDFVRPYEPKKNRQGQTQTNRKHRNLGVIHLKELNVTDGTIWWKFNQWTDGLRPSVQNQKKVTNKHRQTETQKPWGNKRDRWHNLMEINTDGWTSSVRTEPKKRQTNTQTNRNQRNLGGNTSEGIEISIRLHIWRNWNFHQIYWNYIRFTSEGIVLHQIYIQKQHSDWILQTMAKNLFQLLNFESSYRKRPVLITSGRNWNFHQIYWVAWPKE
jgi:hypothetical protein